MADPQCSGVAPDAAECVAEYSPEMLAALGKRSDAEFVMRVVHTMRRALELAELDWEMVEHTAAAVTLEFSSGARIQFTVE